MLMGTEGSCGAGKAGTSIHTHFLAEVDNGHALKYRHAPTRQHGKKKKYKLYRRKHGWHPLFIRMHTHTG
jgi:hypothetical protein